jgi:hypothetical protein
MKTEISLTNKFLAKMLVHTQNLSCSGECLIVVRP